MGTKKKKKKEILKNGDKPGRKRLIYRYIDIYLYIKIDR